MIVALTGQATSADFEHERFVETLADCMTDGVVAHRVLELYDSAPARVPGNLHLSCRAQQRAREVMARGESRGRSVSLPFRAALTKRMPDGPAQHGFLVVERGFDLALIRGTVHRSAPRDWPVLDYTLTRTPSTTILHGCPLIVGNGDTSSAWLHLERSGALAAWPTDSRFLWIFKVVPGHRFPSPFDLASLQRRASGPVNFNRGGKQHE